MSVEIKPGQIFVSGRKGMAMKKTKAKASRLGIAEALGCMSLVGLPLIGLIGGLLLKFVCMLFPWRQGKYMGTLLFDSCLPGLFIIPIVLVIGVFMDSIKKTTSIIAKAVKLMLCLTLVLSLCIADYLYVLNIGPNIAVRWLDVPLIIGAQYSIVEGKPGNIIGMYNYKNRDLLTGQKFSINDMTFTFNSDMALMAKTDDFKLVNKQNIYRITYLPHSLEVLKVEKLSLSNEKASSDQNIVLP